MLHTATSSHTFDCLQANILEKHLQLQLQAYRSNSGRIRTILVQLPAAASYVAMSYLDDDSLSINSADLDDISTSSSSSDDSDVIVGGSRSLTDYGSFGGKKTDESSDAAQKMAKLLELRHQLGMDKDIGFLREEKKLERTKSAGSTGLVPLSPGKRIGSPKGKKATLRASKSSGTGTPDLESMAIEVKIDLQKRKEKEKEGLKKIQAEREKIAAEREKKEKEERLKKEEEARKKKKEEEKRRKKELKKKREEEERRRKEEEERRLKLEAEKKRLEEEERRRKEQEEERRRQAKLAEEERRRKEEEEKRLAAEKERLEREEAERKKISDEELRKNWQKEMEENARKALEAAAAKKAEEEAAAAEEDNDGGGPYYTHKELSEKSVPGLDYKNREIYLKPSEFRKIFGVTKDEFSEWPAWKKTRLKRSNQLLT